MPLLSAKLLLLPGRCQLPVSFAVNLLLAACEHVLRRTVADDAQRLVNTMLFYQRFECGAAGQYAGVLAD